MGKLHRVMTSPAVDRCNTHPILISEQCMKNKKEFLKNSARYHEVVCNYWSIACANLCKVGIKFVAEIME